MNAFSYFSWYPPGLEFAKPQLRGEEECLGAETAEGEEGPMAWGVTRLSVTPETPTPSLWLGFGRGIRKSLESCRPPRKESHPGSRAEGDYRSAARSGGPKSRGDLRPIPD